MPTIKPDSPAIQNYYRALHEAEQQQELNEGNVRAVFENLLRETARDLKGWSLVSKLGERRERRCPSSSAIWIGRRPPVGTADRRSGRGQPCRGAFATVV